MQLAIHNTKDSFSQRWISYCQKKNIPYKIVNCYSAGIMSDLQECDALMWHHQQGNPKDLLFAKELLFSLEQSGKKVFPDFNTAWHFDDKVGQKYLLEALGIKEFIKTWVFYTKEEAMRWAENVEFPKVFKLRSGAGSQNVRLVRDRNVAYKVIKQAFAQGFSSYNAWGSLTERYRKYKLKKASLTDVIKGLVRFIIPPAYARISGRESGYVYFQEFIPGNDSDIRIIVIGDKAFGIKRIVREGDFRASGSGSIIYDKAQIDPRCVSLAFDLTTRLKAQCVAFDFVFDRSNSPLLIEISYGFAPLGYDPCPGYWDKDLNWHEGRFDPYGWMVELVSDHTYKKSIHTA
jgi:glutathione synthase/RimK-type ligase-like ATP-grasp enzyme